MIEEYFGAMIRGIDSSLLDEWEKLRSPGWVPQDEAQPAEAAAPADITRNARAFVVQVRNECFRLVRALASGDFESALGMIEPEGEDEDGRQVRWNADELSRRLEAYRADHGRIQTDAKARDPRNLHVEQGAQAWKAQQILTDSEGHNDWSLRLTIDLAKARELGAPRLRLQSLGVVV